MSNLEQVLWVLGWTLVAGAVYLVGRRVGEERFAKAFLLVEHDERAEAVGNAGARLAYVFLFLGLMIDANYRMYVRHEMCLDLVALVFASFAVLRVYQARHKVLVPGWAKKTLLIMCVSGVIGVIVAAILEAIRAVTRAM